MIEIPKINFDKKGNVIGKHYGECPLCKNKTNLIFQTKGEWTCRSCHYAK